MMEISYENNACCVYDINDWEKLRKEFRIIGTVIGDNYCIPSLPVKLTPEEAIFLLRKNIIKLVEYPELTKPPTDIDKTKFDEFKSRFRDAQRDAYRSIRKQRVQEYIGKIIQGKRNRGDERPIEEIVQEEIEKFDIDDDNMLWYTFCKHHSIPQGPPDEICEEVVLRQTTRTRCDVFEDLWNRGYYITDGDKFGGDFLVYLGDPVMHHAVNIVKCLEDINTTFHPTELVAFGRLANAVKKKYLLAAPSSAGNISYITINWMDTKKIED